MSLMTETAAAAEAVKERLSTAREQLEESMRKGRRVVVRAQHAAEDGTAAVGLQVRRHPLSAIALAVTAGAVAGALIGCALARAGGRESS
jgi:ElaB/YqjD/DUF883 family membrane-anchored ribosome-binding protein